MTSSEFAQMIACPTCRAKVCEPCLTVGGNSTIHELRLVPRRCLCGAVLEPRKSFCEPCRAERRRRTYWRREGRRATSQRRRAYGEVAA